jgi:hypothetical protein
LGAGIKGDKVKKLAFVLLAALLFSIFSGCTAKEPTLSNASNNKTNLTLPINNSNHVPMKPFTDSAIIRAKVLSVQAESAQLEVLEVVFYNADERDRTIKLKKNDTNEFVFQWGTSATTVDMPPLGKSDTDIDLPGVRTGDVIQANVSTSNGQWRVYQYERIG